MNGRSWIVSVVGGVLLIPVAATAREPDCARADAWPAAMAVVHLQNAGLIVSGQIDPAKTRVKRLASERIARNRYRQVHLVSLTSTEAESLSAITVNEASLQECSLSPVDVYVVSRHLGDLTKPQAP